MTTNQSTTAGAVKFPEITVQLSGEDGNAFFVLGKVSKALKSNDVSKEDCDAFMGEATSGDYNHLLQTCMKWVNVE